MPKRPALTSEQADEAVRLYQGGIGSDTLAERFECCARTIIVELRKRGVRIRSGNHTGSRSSDPTPKEIAERAAAIKEQNLLSLRERNPRPITTSLRSLQGPQPFLPKG